MKNICNGAHCEWCRTHPEWREELGLPKDAGGEPCRYLVKLPVRGLGDVIARMTKAVGIKPCTGCKKRQEQLNKLIPFS